MTINDLGELLSGYQSLLPVAVFLIVYTAARRSPGKEIKTAIWIGLVVALLNTVLLIALLRFEVPVSRSQVLGMWFFAPFALFAGFVARSKHNQMQRECDALDPWKSKRAEDDRDPVSIAGDPPADESKEESRRVEIATPKKAALFLIAIAAVAGFVGTVGYFKKVQEDSHQRVVERCPDFDGFDRWKGSYDSAGWEINLNKERRELKISEWLRDDGQASFEVFASPLQRRITVATFRRAIMKGFRDHSDTPPMEFKIRGFTCWRATTCYDDVLWIDFLVFDHETGDLYMVPFYCNAEIEDECFEEIDALFSGAGWHVVGKKLPYFSEWAAQQDSVGQ